MESLSENLKDKSVLVGIPLRENEARFATVDARFMASVLANANTLAKAGLAVEIHQAVSPGLTLDVARNRTVRYLLERTTHTHLFFWDSVAAHTPVIIRRNGNVDCIPICDLAQFTETGKEYVRFNPNDTQVYVGDKRGRWADIVYVMRHPFRGVLYKINTHAGLIDVSGNHSLMRPGNLGPIAGNQVTVGTKLSMPYRQVAKGATGERRFFFGSKDLAWFYGFFAAEGCVSYSHLHVDNNDTKKLERSQKVLRNFFNRDTNIYEASHSREIPTYRIGTGGSKIASFFRSKFYNSLGQKKVPTEILNAPSEIQECFLQGYYEGDGHIHDKYVDFETNSPTLALGLQWMLQTTTQQTYSVSFRDNKPHIIRTSVNQKIEDAKRPHPQYRNKGEVKKIHRFFYSGYLYDIETTAHVFAAGAGPVLAHNSDTLLLPDAILNLLKRGLPIVSGLYLQRGMSHRPVMLDMTVTSDRKVSKMSYRYKDIEEVPDNGQLEEVGVTPGGIFLTERQVFERIAPPWFAFPKHAVGEDVYFSCLLQTAGYKQYVDTAVEGIHLVQHPAASKRTIEQWSEAYGYELSRPD